uniref:Uncharacterized protein n=2 Tax=Graphocephala atropunctata TaxID=36148 RepID=A0A1B6LWV1_9HEMI
MLDSGLTFTDHVTYVIQRALGRLRGLYRYKTLLPEIAKLRVVQSLILSVLYYCFPAFGNSVSGEDMERMQKFQNAALRFVYNLRRRDHVSASRDAANMLPMKTVCRALTCCLVHRVLTLGEPQYLVDRLPSRGEVAHRSTRQEGQLHFPRVRLEIGRKGFSYFGPKLYNDLPCSLKTLNVNSFKDKIWEYFK